MIYLDNAATTRVYDEAIKAMDKVCGEEYFNPSSTYPGGITAKKIITEARASVASALNCSPNAIYFTSCATEANNWALTCGLKNKKGNIVVGSGEHACVYECAKALKSSGVDVRFVPLDSNGIVTPEALYSVMDENTGLVSIMHVSNETGVINDLPALTATAKTISPRCFFHSDGVQAYLKIDNDVLKNGVDLYSLSGHKIGAPKGVGALYISPKLNIRPFIYGGGQESGLRSGTENVAGIAALGVATRIYRERHDNARIAKNRTLLINELKNIPSVKIIAENAPNTGMITAFTALGTKAEIVQTLCAADGVIIGRGSACSSKHSGNRVLSAMGMSQKEIDGALRIGLSPETTPEEIVRAVEVIRTNVEKLRGGRIG